MAITIANIKKSKADKPPRVLIYSPPKVGKTSLAAEFPEPIFLQTEDGPSGGLELNTFGLLDTYENFIQALGALAKEDHEFKTVVIDTIDHLEPLIWQKACESNGWSSIEDAGFGKGYVAADEVWMDVMRGLEFLRIHKGMNVVLLAHSDVVSFDPPGSEPYKRYVLRTHRRATAIIMDDMDIIAFMNFKTEIKEKELGFNKTASHATGGGTRWLQLEWRPFADAGNRYNLDAEMIRIQDSTVQQWKDAGVPIAGL